MLPRETSMDGSLKRRSDDIDEEFEDFEEDKDLDDYDDLDDEFDDEDEDGFRPRKSPRRDWGGGPD